nr:hypothetical protein CFP56_34142 [Quercus suber]
MQAGKLFKLKLRMQVECRGKDDLAVMAFLSCVIEWGFGASFFPLVLLGVKRASCGFSVFYLMWSRN